MKLAALQTLIAAGESQTLEFKASFDKTCIATLVAFAIIIAVAHHQFKAVGPAAIRALGKPEHVLYDLKYLLPASDSDLRL
jgi:UDP-N-acetyl-D-mannosaminuronate dehydrogenase